MSLHPVTVHVDGIDPKRPTHLLLRVELSAAPDAVWITCFHAAAYELPDIPGDPPVVEGREVLLRVPDDSVEHQLVQLDLRIKLANELREGKRPVGVVIGKPRRLAEAQITQVDIPMTPGSRILAARERAVLASAAFTSDLLPAAAEPTRAEPSKRRDSDPGAQK